MAHASAGTPPDIRLTFSPWKETVRAFLIFAALLSVILLIATRLAFRELGLSVWTQGTGVARQEAQAISEVVLRFGRTSGGLDFHRVRANRVHIEDYIRQRLRSGLPIQSVEVRDRFGIRQLFVEQDLALYPRLLERVSTPSADWLEGPIEKVRVPLGRGDGEVLVAVAADPMFEEWLQLRRSLQIKIAIAASLAVGVLVSGLFYVLNLIKRNRELEQARQSAARASYVGLLASGLAHEIRNPLNAMNMNLQMLEEELQALPLPPDPDDHDFHELVESNKSEIKRLERLVNNFLAYARPSIPHMEPRDLNAVLGEVARFLAGDFRQSEVALETSFEPLLPTVEIDEAQFKQAVMNLLVNARQVLAPGGRVDLRTRPGSRGDVVVEIEDDGPGIPVDKQERIFDVFYSSRGGGTGLGLPIARQIVERHGGTIQLDSEPGRGTLFRIHLPRRQRAGRAADVDDDVAEGGGAIG